mgnify:FL=1
MRRFLAIMICILLISGCASVTGPLLKDTPRKALPTLAEAEAIQPLACPAGILFRAGFDEKDDMYQLMFFGPITPGDPPVPGYPHVWIRYIGRDMVAILLVLAPDKMAIITKDELMVRYPTVCDLLGQVV